MSLLGQMVCFASVGAFATVAHYIVLILIVDFLKMNPVFGSSIGFITGAIVNYYLNYHWTFNSSKNHLETSTKFFIIASIGFIINSCIMFVMIQTLSFHHLSSQVLATGIVFFWNFAGNKIWTFGQPKSFQENKIL